MLTLLLCFLFSLCVAQQQLQAGQITSGTVNPGQQLFFFFLVTTPDQQHIIELTGNPDFSNGIALTLTDPTGLFLRPFTESDSIVSIGSSFIDGPHAYGIGCPANFTSGNYTLRVNTQSGSPQPFSIRYTVEDASLNGGRVVSEEVCCTGNGRVVAKNYFFDISPEATEVSIYMMRDSSGVTISGLENILYARYGDCPENVDITSDYQFTLVDSGVTLISINENSQPPLVPGARLFLTQVKSILTGNIPETYVLSVCEGVGCDPDPGVTQSSDSSSLSSSLLGAFTFFILLF